jgi:predicted nucleic acid-binding protein
MTIYYIDTSAFVKLVVAESHSDELMRWVRAHKPTLIASDLMAVEALRTARRHSVAALAATRERLSAITFVRVSRSICDRAAELDPAITRSLDSVHLATALEFSHELVGVITYDTRMADAANTLGLTALAPGN